MLQSWVSTDLSGELTARDLIFVKLYNDTLTREKAKATGRGARATAIFTAAENGVDFLLQL